LAVAGLRPEAIRGVLFDMDGLLLDSERLYLQAFREACEAHGQEMREAVWLRCIGTTDAVSRQILADGFGPDFPLDAVLGDWRQRFVALQSQGIEPKPQVAELLSALHAWQVPMGLVTSTGRSLAGLKLYQARLGEYFTIRVCGGEARASKPDPAPYVLGCKLLGLPAAECLVLEDSANGVRAAAAAGAQVVQVPDLVPPSPEILALGHTVHNSLADTLEMLSRSRSPGAGLR